MKKNIETLAEWQTLLIREGQTGERWEPSKNQRSFGSRDHCKENDFHILKGL